MEGGISFPMTEDFFDAGLLESVLGREGGKEEERLNK